MAQTTKTAQHAEAEQALSNFHENEEMKNLVRTLEELLIASEIEDWWDTPAGWQIVDTLAGLRAALKASGN